MELARSDNRGIISIASLRAAVDEGNKTAMMIESGQLTVSDLGMTRANKLYVYLLFRNSVSLLGGPDSK